jgi:hypothetical protein
VDSNLVAAYEVLGVVDELLMNPINFHVDYPSRLMKGRDQWVLVQVVIDHLGQDVHTSSPIAEHMMDHEWPQDARNCGE